MYEDFNEMIKMWGFEANEDLIFDLFKWLDYDKDNRISYEDLR